MHFPLERLRVPCSLARCWGSLQGGCVEPGGGRVQPPRGLPALLLAPGWPAVCPTVTPCPQPSRAAPFPAWDPSWAEQRLGSWQPPARLLLTAPLGRELRCKALTWLPASRSPERRGSALLVSVVLGSVLTACELALCEALMLPGCRVSGTHRPRRAPALGPLRVPYSAGCALPAGPAHLSRLSGKCFSLVEST